MDKKVPSEEIIEAVKAYGLAYSTPNTTATELTIRLQDILTLLDRYGQPAQPAASAEPVYQFRKKHCADWYDGHPDHSDGGGPYEVRTLYAAPVAARPAETDEWKLAIDHELTAIQSTADSYPSAKEAVKDLIDWHVAVAADPVLQQSPTSKRMEKLRVDPVKATALDRAKDRVEEEYKIALCEWLDKTEFIQELVESGNLSSKFLGWHRADVMEYLLTKYVIGVYND